MFLKRVNIPPKPEQHGSAFFCPMLAEIQKRIGLFEDFCPFVLLMKVISR
jgi:hypothetical protein